MNILYALILAVAVLTGASAGVNALSEGEFDLMSYLQNIFSSAQTELEQQGSGAMTENVDPNSDLAAGMSALAGMGAVNMGPKQRGLTLAWNIPAEREDGKAIALSEISGYELYYTVEELNVDQTIVINGATQTQYKLEDIAPGTYHIAISAIDNNGLRSRLSDPVTVEVN